MSDDHGALISKLIPVLIIVAVVARVALRNAKPRPLKIELMWIRPLLFLALAGALMFSSPPPLTLIAVVLIIVALALGCALGWQRGKLIHIEVHPETHEVIQRASPAALIFLVVLIGLRYGARTLAVEVPGGAPVSLNLITDALGLFTIAMMITQSAEMWLRARRLLALAKAG